MDRGKYESSDAWGYNQNDNILGGLKLIAATSNYHF